MDISPLGSSYDSSLPSSFGASPPSTSIFNSITTLWALFHNGSGSIPAANTPQFWSMLQSSVNAFMAQFGNPPKPPTDQPTLAIYNDLNQTLFEYQGKPISLFTLCSEPSATAVLDMANDFSSGSPLSNCLAKLQGDIDTWYSTYYPGGSGEPQPTPPANFQAEFTQLQTDLKNLINAWPGAPQYNAALKAVVTDISDLETTLSSAGSLDGYGQLTLDFLNSSFTSDGSTTSLASLASAINKAGWNADGSPVDSADAATLGQWLILPPTINPPFQQPQPLSSQLLNWIGSVLKWEFPTH